MGQAYLIERKHLSHPVYFPTALGANSEGFSSRAVAIVKDFIVAADFVPAPTVLPNDLHVALNSKFFCNRTEFSVSDCVLLH